jgi:hypothetical protein
MIFLIISLPNRRFVVSPVGLKSAKCDRVKTSHYSGMANRPNVTRSQREREQLGNDNCFSPVTPKTETLTPRPVSNCGRQKLHTHRFGQSTARA